MEYTLCAPCSFGCESVLGYEVRKHLSGDCLVQDGRVTFAGDENTLAAANIVLRSADRIYIQTARFEAKSFDRLFDGVSGVAFEKYMPENAAFPVTGHCLDSVLSSVPACQRIVKKAIAERMKRRYKTDFLPESGPVYRFNFTLRKNSFRLYLDTSGEPLHKRGYRRQGGTAPIKETLAASIADLARIKSDSLAQDPFCGSGTLLIEAAMRAAGIAPGQSRRFAAENYPFIPARVWQNQREAAEKSADRNVSFKAFGSDIDSNIIKVARLNAKKAGVAHMIDFSVADVRNFKPRDKAVIISNPPYGQRLSDAAEAAELEKILGEKYTSSRRSGRYVITSDSDFEANFGLPAKRRRKLYNGMIPCRLYMYF